MSALNVEHLTWAEKTLHVPDLSEFQTGKLIKLKFANEFI